MRRVKALETGGGSQTPWTSNIDAGQYNLTDVGTITFDDGAGADFDLYSNFGSIWFEPNNAQYGAYFAGGTTDLGVYSAGTHSDPPVSTDTGLWCTLSGWASTSGNDFNIWALGYTDPVLFEIQANVRGADVSMSARNAAGTDQTYLSHDVSADVTTMSSLSITESQVTSPTMHLLLDVTTNCGGANGTVTYLPWDDDAPVLKDTGYTHEDTTNPTRIQVDADGRYSIYFSASFTQGGSARTTLMSHLRVDGTTSYTRGRQRNYSRGSGYGDISLVHYTELDLTDGQYIECGITVDDTDAAYTINTINAECEMIIRKLS